MKKFTISAEMFSALLTKAGVADKETFKKLLASEDGAELTQEQFNELTASLLSMEDAVKNPNVINALKGQIFQPTEDRLKEILKTNGVSDDDIKKLLDGKQNADKIAAAMDKLKELSSKNDGSAAERENAWKATKKQLEDAANEWKTKFEAETSARAADRVDAALTAFISNSDNFKLRSDIPLATQLKIAKAELKEAIAAKGATLTADANGNLKVVYANEPEKDFFEPGSATAYDLKAGTNAVLESSGLLNKQPGETRKEEIIIPGGGSGAPVSTQAAAAFAANHNAIAASMQE